jgi:hypothetical protein
MKAFYSKVTDQYDLEPSDLLILGEACNAWDRAAEAREGLKRGLMLRGKVHPLVAVEARYIGLFLTAMKQLGLDIDPPGPIGRPSGRN